MPDQAIRFGLSDGGGNRAATWKLWTPTGKSDIYLACRALGGVLKASLHESGSWHIAYSEAAYVNLVEGVIPTQQGRFVEIWHRPKPIAPGITLAYRIVTPSSAITSPISQSGHKVTWIPNCPLPQATEVDILICSPSTPVTDWPGKNSTGTKLVGSYKLASDETVWVVYWIVDMPDLSQATKGTGRFYRGRSEEDLISDDLRAIVFGSEPDGSRVIYDCAVIGKSSSSDQ